MLKLTEKYYEPLVVYYTLIKKMKIHDFIFSVCH